MKKYLYLLWKRLKTWRVIPIGPVSFVFRMTRTKHVSSNFKRKIISPTPGILEANEYISGLENSSQRTLNNSNSEIKEVAVIFGAGDGYGYGLAKYFAKKGMKIALVARNAEKNDLFVNKLIDHGVVIRSYGANAVDERSVSKVFSLIEKEFGVPSLVVTCFQGFFPGKSVDIEVCAFEESWRQNCLGPFIVGREAARLMTPNRNGTIIFTGATSGVIGRAGYLNLAVGKHGLRALAQVMAKELNVNGIHVAHLIIDADIFKGGVEDEDPHMYPNEIAETVYFLHKQPRSAWTLELDARPWNEEFWQHC